MASVNSKLKEYQNYGVTSQVGGVNPSFGEYTFKAGRTEGSPNYEQFDGELNTINGTGVIGSVTGTNPDGSSAAQDIAKKLGMPKLVG